MPEVSLIAPPRHAVRHDTRLLGREFVYQSDEDQNGLLHYMGTKQGGQDHSRVKVTASSMNRQRQPGWFCTYNQPQSWWAFDLGVNHAIRPTRYTLLQAYTLQSWVLEASNDNQTWQVLRTHTRDLALRARRTASWPLTADRLYRHFRVRQTGPNSSGTYRLLLPDIELYGATLL